MIRERQSRLSWRLRNVVHGVSTHRMRNIKPYAVNGRVPTEPSRWRRRVGARQAADLAELKDWVEGLRAAAHTARKQGNITLAKALDNTRFEVYESYLDEEYTNTRAKRLMIKN
jgi:hypothetical protein